ncbi:MAG: Ku protein [Promicromonosporaceae bacterium]|nr:Ku protein [Promicromonosporaceae bacterium]
MHSIWKGAVSFGLVNVPVKLYAATHSHDLTLHQLHVSDGGRIRYQKVCEIDGEVVIQRDIVKGFTEGNRNVMLTKEDLTTLPAERSREIEVVEFVPSDQVDPIMFANTYYLEPDSKSAKAYVLLRKVLEETNRTAIVKFALREKSHLGVLRVRDEVLVLQTLLWSDEVRKPDFPAIADTKVSDRELAMAKQLVTSFEADFEPDQYVDEYQNQLKVLIDDKLAKGNDVTVTEAFGKVTESDEAEMTDLMTALRKSVAAAKARAVVVDEEEPKKKPTARTRRP